MHDAGLRVSSVCRGGFFTGVGDLAAGRARTTTTAARSTRQPRSAPRAWCWSRVASLPVTATCAAPASVPRPRWRHSSRTPLDVGVRLAIEPMHPIFAADRGVVSTLGQALDIAEPLPVDAVGVVVDTFHVWWEPGVEEQIARAGDRIASYQVCEWITPLPPDALLSRGMMGDGHIDFARLTSLVATAGYTGDVEVEIFNADVWAADGRRRCRHARPSLRRAGGAPPLADPFVARPLSHLGKEREHMHRRRITTALTSSARPHRLVRQLGRTRHFRAVGTAANSGTP